MSVIFFGVQELGDIAVAIQNSEEPLSASDLAKLLSVVSACNAEAYNDSYRHHGENVVGHTADEIYDAMDIRIYNGWTSEVANNVDSTVSLLAYNCVSNNGTDYGLHPWAQMALRALNESFLSVSPTYSWNQRRSF